MEEGHQHHEVGVGHAGTREGRMEERHQPHKVGVGHAGAREKTGDVIGMVIKRWETGPTWQLVYSHEHTSRRAWT